MFIVNKNHFFFSTSGTSLATATISNSKVEKYTRKAFFANCEIIIIYLKKFFFFEQRDVTIADISIQQEKKNELR